MSWTFLTIPPEIRDTIIETVLLLPRLAPANVQAAESTHPPAPTDYRYGRGIFSSWKYGPSHVRFEDPLPINPQCLTLLLINRQLNTETHFAIERLAEKARHHKLDVMLVDEKELWSTWTCLPVAADQVDQVDVTFRIFGNDPAVYGPEFDRGAFTIGDGSPPQIYWCFYYLLEHFLKRGPVDTTHSGDLDRGICIKVLNLDFVAGQRRVVLEEGDQKTWRNTKYGRGYREDTGQDATRDMGMTRPEWLMSHVTGGLRSLLYMGYHTAGYSGILYERVGVIRISVEGRPIEELDVGGTLAELNFDDPIDTFGHMRTEKRLEAFWKWKEHATMMRVQHGFPVVFEVTANNPRGQYQLPLASS